jgi:hypothetical protein
MYVRLFGNEKGTPLQACEIDDKSPAPFAKKGLGVLYFFWDVPKYRGSIRLSTSELI